MVKAKAALISVGIVRDTVLGKFIYFSFAVAVMSLRVNLVFSFLSCFRNCFFSTNKKLVCNLICPCFCCKYVTILLLVNGKDSFKSSGRIIDSDMHDVGRFLNRLLGLPPEIQNR